MNQNMAIPMIPIAIDAQPITPDPVVPSGTDSAGFSGFTAT
ncbi:hypothetical protein ATK30_5225 [Amycolatopsis echigonensis]|uniref:Uncharacterized protein n=1 Tax=Amycolatopsis echigonensis TaxID=2576905 RepID=A0A2N3WKF5_9PSEU|nr:hypothetical protein [Amycolatopsis niigatensis]PKV94348.1 hypothetical protein ATK30_5225 [Amycolatopsis niigatensis]